MDEKRDESVEELAEKLESRLFQTEETGGMEEPDLGDDLEEWEPEGELAEGWRENGVPAKKARGKRHEELHEEDLEDDWEEEEAEPMSPLMVAVVFAGLIALAAVICAVLWHFTHPKQEGADQSSRLSSSYTGDTAQNPEAEPEATPTASPDAAAATPAVDITATPEPVTPPVSTPGGAASASVPPAASQATAPPVQEPVSGTTAMEFTQSTADVTPKDVINLRSEPSTVNADNIVIQAKNGEVLSRTGVNEATGWTRIDYNGETLYAVSQYLTTDLEYKTPVQAANPNRVNTMDGRVILFTDYSDNITPKEYVNLRTEPSTSGGESTVRCQVSNGEVVHRTGYSPDAGWSRVEYNGEVLYVVSSYVYTVE